MGKNSAPDAGRQAAVQFILKFALAGFRSIEAVGETQGELREKSFRP
jgi:hypothetical protein